MMNNMKIEKRGVKLAGKLKVWQSRLASYVGVINFLMIFYLYIIESPLRFKWYYWGLIVILCITVLMFIDIRYIYPASQEYSFSKNPEMTKLREKINQNSDKLDEIFERVK